MFTPKLEILPPSQRRLWDELGHTPKDFVLYGVAALALRLGHRRSEDFDFKQFLCTRPAVQNHPILARRRSKPV